LPLDEPARAAARYLALTADEVRAAFARWIGPERFVQVVRGPMSP
jgi:zinc protease